MNKYTPDNPHQEIPAGYCHCGCGQKTRIAPYSDKRYGWIRNHPIQFISGHHRRKPLKECFWEKVLVIDDADSCWPWQGSRTHGGYGRIHVKGKGLQAHRVAWELVHGPIPEGMDVLHHCDNPPCCRESHLFLGTDQDNVNDRERKGRNNPPKGENHNCAKLTESQVREIRYLYANERITYAEIGKRYGITGEVVGNIIRRKNWKHIL